MASKSRHLVVDGSNIATESRTLPSLAQLDEAVRAVIAEDPDRTVTVIVDATFSHRIDARERKALEEAMDAGEIIMPPAGAVGRGDAFILQVAARVDAAVLSNDSFQEFHGEHEWLFDEGRLIGGKPIEGVGWIFVPRVPVRGPASRRATRKSGGSKKASKRSSSRSRPSIASGPPPKPSAETPPPTKKQQRSANSKPTKAKKTGANVGDEAPSKTRSKTGDEAPSKTRSKTGDEAPSKTRSKTGDEAPSKTREKTGDEAPSKTRSKTGDEAPSKTRSKTGSTAAKKSGSGRKDKSVRELNSPDEFMRFVTRHSLGDEVPAVIESFSSHGCYLRAAAALCYLPSSAMGDPPPSKARDVVSLGQDVIVRVDSIDAERRGINVVLVNPSAGLGDRKISAGNTRGNEEGTTTHGRRADDGPTRESSLTRSNTTVATKKTAKKTAAKKRAAKKAAKKTPTKKTAAKATSSTRAKRAAARKTTKKRPVKKATAKKTAKKATKSTAKKTAKKATKSTAKKTAKKATKSTAKKTAKKATKSTAKKTTKSTAKKRPAKKATKKA